MLFIVLIGKGANLSISLIQPYQHNKGHDSCHDPTVIGKLLFFAQVLVSLKTQEHRLIHVANPQHEITFTLEL